MRDLYTEIKTDLYTDFCLLTSNEEALIKEDGGVWAQKFSIDKQNQKWCQPSVYEVQEKFLLLNFIISDWFCAPEMQIDI